MNEANARLLTLVRAVETADTDETIWRREDRDYVTRPPRSQQAGQPDTEAGLAGLLVQRAERARERLMQRAPEIARLTTVVRWPRWISWALPTIAFLIGATASELDSGRWINIISFPLAGMLLWNLVVYIGWLIQAAMPKRQEDGFGHWATGRLLAIWQRTAWSQWKQGATDASRRIVSRFFVDWMQFASSLYHRQINAALHLSAATFALGMVAGMYASALALEYRAGWESTFIDEHALHQGLRIVLGPASFLTGIALPGPQELRLLRWGPDHAGGNGGAWIHLYAATVLLWVVLPRLVLWAWNTWQAMLFRRNVNLPLNTDPYFRRLMMAYEGKGTQVRVVPYSYHPSERVRTTLTELLFAVVGDKAQVHFDPPIPYGGEDDYMDAINTSAGPQPEYVIILFNLAATPEEENQGALVEGIRSWQAANGQGGHVAVVLDESAYRQKIVAHNTGHRLPTRQQAWQDMLRVLDVAHVSLDLGELDLRKAAPLLEAAMKPQAMV